MADGQSGASPPLRLRLYVAGETPGARRAIASRKRLLEACDGTLDIEIIETDERRDAAEAAGILATPALSDEATRPPRRLIGDISNIAQVLDFFGHRKEDRNP